MLQPTRADCSAEHSYDRVIPDMSRRLTACDRSCSCLLPIGASIDPAAGGETEQPHPQTCHDEEHLAFHSIPSVFFANNRLLPLQIGAGVGFIQILIGVQYERHVV